MYLVLYCEEVRIHMYVIETVFSLHNYLIVLIFYITLTQHCVSYTIIFIVIFVFIFMCAARIGEAE